MRDLKHMIEFEELLRSANNEMVKAACAEGRLALAYNCSHIPEVLLDVPGCFACGCARPLREPGHGDVLHDEPLLPLLQEHT